MVLAVLVLGLPKAQQKQALRYGILGAFAVPGARDAARGLSDRARLGEAARRRLPAVPGRTSHFCERRAARGAAHAAESARPWLGMTAFWATVVKVELTDIVFAIDSILVAVAMSPKLWVILTGGILGIIDDAAGHRPAAGARRALSGARRRRVRHHRVGRHQAADRVPACRRATSASKSRSGCRSA